MKKSQRYYWLDYCRSLAILFVIVVHTTESVYFFNQVSFENYSSSRHVLMFTLFTLGRLGVPLFLFITGYLLLDRQYDYTYSQKFYKKI